MNILMLRWITSCLYDLPCEEWMIHLTKNEWTILWRMNESPTALMNRIVPEWITLWTNEWPYEWMTFHLNKSPCAWMNQLQHHLQLYTCHCDDWVLGTNYLSLGQKRDCHQHIFRVSQHLSFSCKYLVVKHLYIWDGSSSYSNILCVCVSVCV